MKDNPSFEEEIVLLGHCCHLSTNISSNDRHHHKLSSLDNNTTRILYVFLNASKIPITRGCHCLKASIVMLRSPVIQELKISS